MKSVYSLLLVLLFSANAFAQEDTDEDKKGGFKKENLFTGGSLNLSFGSGTTALGISPYFGYSLNKYVDVAVSAGINYISQRQYDYYYNYQGKIRQTIYGPGAFVRVFPVKFIFLQAQYEYNAIKYKVIYNDNYGLPDEKYRYNASSLLLGAGYAGGREEGSNSFYYFSVSFDVAGSKNSPYIEYNNADKRVIPIIRAGYNFALFQNKVVRGRRTSEN